MKKTINLALFYAILAMVGGVFYREFTKFMAFEGRTTLSFVHTHLFLLGMFFFLIVTFAIKLFHIQKSSKYKKFLWFYNPGVLLTATMLVVRGILQVNGVELSSGMNGMISGIAGVGHILTGVGLVYFLLTMKECVSDEHDTVAN